MTDAKDRRIAELEAQLDASVLEAALDSEARLARRVAELEAERDALRRGELTETIAAIECERNAAEAERDHWFRECEKATEQNLELEAERDRLRSALAEIMYYPFDVMREAHEDRAAMCEIARAALAGEEKPRDDWNDWKNWEKP